MEISSFYRELIVALITTAFATLLAIGLDALTANRQLSIMAFLVALLLMLSVYAYVSYRREKSILGIRKIFRAFDAAPKTLEIITDAKRSVDFLGVSARTFFESEEVEDSMKKKIKEGCVFRFLLLDPEAPLLESKAKDEGDDPEAWRHDIRASILRLDRIGKETDTEKVKIKLYNALPIWRLLFVDEASVHVTYYPHGHRGKHSPLFALDEKKISLYDPFRSFFEYLWGISHETRTL